MSTKLSAVLASTALDRDSTYATILASSSATLATIEAPMANLMRRRSRACCRVSGALLLAPAPPRARCSPPPPPAAAPLPSSGSCSQRRAEQLGEDAAPAAAGPAGHVQQRVTAALQPEKDRLYEKSRGFFSRQCCVHLRMAGKNVGQEQPQVKGQGMPRPACPDWQTATAPLHWPARRWASGACASV